MIEMKFSDAEVQRLFKKLSRLPAEVNKKVEEALKEGAEKHNQIAASKAPRLTGELQGRFGVERERRSTYIKFTSRNYAPHAHLMELGYWLTKKIKGAKVRLKRIGTDDGGPRPFMRPAFDESAEGIQQDIVEKAREALAQFEGTK